MFFVILHGCMDMNKAPIKIISLLMILWYCVSIIGFDVHTCSASGRSFVSTLLSGYTCEDIHPEHSCSSHGHDCCHDHDCCSHEEDCRNEYSSLESSSCCQDNIRVLHVTGLNPSDGHRHYDVCLAGPCLCVKTLIYDILPSFGNDGPEGVRVPDSGLLVPEDTQAVLGIWRI